MVLGAGEVVTGKDFGNQPPFGEIRGTKFEDLDGDGTRDAGEPAMAGVTVYLDADDDQVLDADELSQVTDADGNYAFTQLLFGNYVVREIVPANYRQTFPAITSNRLFTVNPARASSSNSTRLAESFVISSIRRAPPSRSGKVWPLTGARSISSPTVPPTSCTS